MPHGLLLLLLAACGAPPGAAPTGSRSADLATRAGDVSRRAEILAQHTRELEGLFDSLRAAPEEEKTALKERIHARALELREEAQALRDDVVRIEAGAQIY